MDPFWYDGQALQRAATQKAKINIERADDLIEFVFGVIGFLESYLIDYLYGHADCASTATFFVGN